MHASLCTFWPSMDIILIQHSKRCPFQGPGVNQECRGKPSSTPKSENSTRRLFVIFTSNFTVQGHICRGRHRGHVLVTEFRDMALNGLFCADVLRATRSRPLIDYT